MKIKTLLKDNKNKEGRNTISFTCLGKKQNNKGENFCKLQICMLWVGFMASRQLLFRYILDPGDIVSEKDRTSGGLPALSPFIQMTLPGKCQRSLWNKLS